MAKKILCIFIGSANDLVNSAYISCFFKVENSFSYALYQSPFKTLISSQASYKSNLDFQVWSKQKNYDTKQNYTTEQFIKEPFCRLLKSEKLTLISLKCPFDVFKSPKKTRLFSRISALASKTYFFDLTSFQRLGQKSWKKFRLFFGRFEETKRTF